MKKIFSLVIVLALMFACASACFATNDYTITMELTDEDDNAITDLKDLSVGDKFAVSIYLSDIPENIRQFGMVATFDSSLISLTEVDSDQKISKKNYFGPNKAATADGTGYALTYMGEPINTGSYTFDEEDIFVKLIFSKVAETGSAVVTITQLDITDASYNEYRPSNAPSMTIVLGESGGGDPTPAATVTIAKSGDDTYFLGADGGEYGSAFRITFDRPAAATSNDAIFGVTAGGTRKYSPKQTGVLAGLSGTITLNVSFLNGSTAAGSLGVIEPKEVTAASVIMSDGAGNFFYTDEADAK